MASKFNSYTHFALLFLVTALLLLSGLGKIDVNIMEARNFVSAREMVQNNEYLLTTLNDEPRYQKPPLPTWLTAASGLVFGFDSLFFLRLPVVAVTFLLVFAFYYFSKGLELGATNSLNNALILITSFYIFFAGRDNQWDMYAHSFMIVSIFFLFRLLHSDQSSLRNSLLAGLFLGLSILSKGPVSLYALLLPFLISYGIVYPISFSRKWLFLLNMLVTSLLIGISWYVYVRLKDPESFMIMAAHETSNWTHYELKPFYYYWSFFLQSGLWATASLTALFYPYLKSKVSNLKAYRLAVLWTLFSLVLLSIVPEKKIRYLVPVLIPLALTTGFYIEYLLRNFNKSMGKWERRGVYFLFGIFAIIAVAYPFVLIYLLKENLQRYIFIVALSSILIYICAWFILKGFIQKNFGKVFYAMIAVFTIVVMALIPLHKTISYNPHFTSTGKVHTIEREQHINTFSLTEVSPEIVWDFGTSIPLLERKGDSIYLPVENRFGLMVDRRDSIFLQSQFPGYTIEKVYQINLHSAKREKERLIKDYYLLSKIKNWSLAH